jgi:hypothetical protein
MDISLIPGTNVLTRLRRIDYSTMTTVRVGRESKSFNVHRSLLDEYAPGILSQQPEWNSESEIILSHVKPDDFELWLDWIYSSTTENLAVLLNGHSSSPENSRRTISDYTKCERRISLLIRLWSLGSTLSHHALMNEAVNILIKENLLDGSRALLGYAFHQCPVKGEVRTLVLDYTLSQLSTPEDLRHRDFFFNESLILSAFERLLQKNIPAADIRAPTLADACDYHRHPTDEEDAALRLMVQERPVECRGLQAWILSYSDHEYYHRAQWEWSSGRAVRIMIFNGSWIVISGEFWSR